MAEKITAEQLNNLEEECTIDTDGYHKLLEEYTGIVAKPYTGYSYYDSVGNYLGDWIDCDVKDLLDAAYIKVEG